MLFSCRISCETVSIDLDAFSAMIFFFFGEGVLCVSILFCLVSPSRLVPRLVAEYSHAVKKAW